MGVGALMAKTSSSERAELSRALAKAIAYRDCNQPGRSAEWIARLVSLLDAGSILRPEVEQRSQGLVVL